MIKAALAIVATLALITACDSSDKHKGEHCTHEVTILIPITVVVGKVPVTNFIPTTSCNRWVPNGQS